MEKVSKHCNGLLEAVVESSSLEGAPAMTECGTQCPGLVDMVFSHRLDSMVSVVVSNLNDSVIP